MNEFEQAHEEFLSQLSEKEKAQFTQIKTSEEFLTGLENFGQFAKNKRKWTKLFRSVEMCSEKLNPYFAVVGITVQSNPQWAAIAWGAFRLVLLLACNYGTFFNKLGDLLEQLSSKIPAYKSLSEILKKSKVGVGISQRFQTSLRAFYVDLFEIFRGIARVFTQKNGKLKKTPVIIGHLLWQPFDVRFANILQRLDTHCEILKLEIDVMHFKTSNLIATSQAEEQSRNDSFESKLMDYNNLVCQMKQRFNENEKQSLLDKIKAWIRPSSFVGVFERLSALRQEGTAEWIFQAESYERWMLGDANEGVTESMERFLWVRGNPGTGKSVLAASVVQELMASAAASRPPLPLVNFFFFEYNARDGRPDPRDYAYRAILSQLLHQLQEDEDILEVFSFALTRRRHGQLTATTDELVDLIRTLATRINCWYIVIDAVDECADSDDLLLELSRALGDRSTKVLLFSRPNLRFLLQKMTPPQILTVSRLLNEEDLKLYFDTHLQHLQDLSIIPSYASRKQLVENLLTGADGMFQWARLMISHLQSDGLLPWERLNVITKLKSPEKLDDMYIRILDLLSKKLTSEQYLARRLFLWVIFGKKSINASQLQDILTPQREESSGHANEICRRAKEDEFIDFEHNVIMVSGSLIESRWCAHSKATIYSFIHSSVMEFFKSRCDAPRAICGSKAGTVDYFLPAACEAEAELTLTCLSYIFQRVPDKPLSGNMFEAASRVGLCDLLPFLSYAALYWPRHLMSMSAPLTAMHASNLDSFYHSIEAVLATLGRFLLSRLMPMVWVELKYTFERRSEGHDEIHDTLLQWTEWAQDLNLPNLPNDDAEVPIAIAAFTGDLIKLHELWGDTLLVGPHQIWNDITAFTTSPFFVATSAVTIKSLTAESSNRSGLSTTPLSKISRDDPSTEFLAVLTIWPSRIFEMHWRNSTPRRKRQIPENHFDGWIAQYELWNIEDDDPVIIEDSRIPLDRTEVRVQYERFQKHVTGFSKTISTQAAGKELALHFPSSISTDLNTISVLRTVFKRRQPILSRSTSASSDAFGDLWRPILMPIRHTIQATLLQGLSKPAELGKTAGIHKAAPLAHSRAKVLRLDRTPAFRMITFRDYVLYQSVEGSDALSEDEDAAGTIAVYLLTHAEGFDDIRLLGCIEGDGARGSIHHCVFHPKYPLLAFHYRSRTGISQIVLWCFAKGISSDAHSFVLLNHAILQPGSMGGFSISCVATIKWTLKYLQFSACGTNLIYQLHNSPNPHTKFIQGSHVYNIAMQQAESERTNSQVSPSCTKLAPQSHALEGSNALPQSMILNRPVLYEDGSSTRLSFDSGAANRNIKLVHCTGEVEKEQSLLSLPAWHDVKNISVSMRMPSRRRDDKVAIVLNKTAQPFYVLGNGGEHTPPAVVRKDIRAIGKPKVESSSYLGKAESTTSWRGIGFYDKSSEDEGGPRKKRARTSNA